MIAALLAAAALTGNAGTCSASELSARVHDSSGAAGTIAVSITLTNRGPACTLRGYAGLQLRNAGGPLPTTVVHGGLAFLKKTPKLVHLAYGGKATLLIAYNDVPSGSGPCRKATRLLIRPPGASAGISLGLTLLACRGRIYEAPILAGVRSA